MAVFSLGGVSTIFVFLTDIQAKRKNAAALVDAGRRRWKIENEGFNTQKKHGYYMEHLFSRNYQAIKNHYFLTQIGHMISQIMEALKKLWKKSGLDMAEKHARILESFRSIKLCEYEAEIDFPRSEWKIYRTAFLDALPLSDSSQGRNGAQMV